MRPFAFVDCESTGLNPKRHEVYEVAITKVTFDPDTKNRVESDKDFWIEPLQLQFANPTALQVGKFYERRAAGHQHGSKVVGERMRYEAAIEIAHITEGCHLVGAKPDFDAGFLNAFLRDNGAAPAWHHRLIDVESLAIGLIPPKSEGWGQPQSLSDICSVLGIKREDHTARGDCNAAREVFFKLMSVSEQGYSGIWREEPTRAD